VTRRAWSWLILRPAAIYGPDRGVHVAMREGTHRLWGSGENRVSRIHVDDLAAHAEAGLLSELSGAWPVADDEPCRAREIAQFCADLLGVPMPPPSELKGEDTRRADRRVDGRAVRLRLGVELQYPSYRVGIPAALKGFE
jgi:nucleoside-diphosphate-sugar epimerase